MRERLCVIKIGSNALLGPDQRLDAAFLHELAGQIADAVRQHWRPVIVSSGAVASGVARLGLSSRPPGLPERQALAAIGQIGLSHAWEQALAAHGLVAAQLLLTHGDFAERERNHNLFATVRALFAFGAIPVINENDPIATRELTVGDNDHLAALVASQFAAAQLILLTDIDGVYDRDPRQDPQARRIPLIPAITASILAAAGGAGAKGRGGMRSKVEGARLAAASGVPTVIAAARTPRVITRALAGEDIGTRVLARGRRVDARRRWLALARRVKGRVHIDAGAAQAILQRGSSLLPAGITRVDGHFHVGDTVAVIAPDGLEIARGLAGIPADELAKICGLRSDRAAALLGHPLPKAAIHRDDLLVLSAHGAANEPRATLSEGGTF
ncbi:MAG: glutamate 5-kinase [Planctomycetota bacterium]|nr:glutamate 5-kinase [Planctomycetota bacterium]MCX8040145.1 glutamate 5-kinase [Planctomycetota bacterium]MDW8373397.1 glutamate 5-kinase [Planctomycetota bacterium]